MSLPELPQVVELPVELVINPNISVQQSGQNPYSKKASYEELEPKQ